MRKWEEIVKDKLEGYESPLPEGHLADFRARRMKAGEASRRFPWGLVATAAVAASLAALLFLWKPAVPEENIRVAEGDTPVTEEDVRVTEVPPEVSLPPSRPRPLLARADTKTPVEENTSADTPQTATPPQTAGEPTAGAEAETVTVTPASPFIPQGEPARPMRFNVGAAAGIVAGGGLLAGVLTPLVSNRSVPVPDPGTNGYTNGGPSPVTPDVPMTDPGPDRQLWRYGSRYGSRHRPRPGPRHGTWDNPLHRQNGRPRHPAGCHHPLLPAETGSVGPDSADGAAAGHHRRTVQPLQFPDCGKIPPKRPLSGHSRPAGLDLRTKPMAGRLPGRRRGGRLLRGSHAGGAAHQQRRLQPVASGRRRHPVQYEPARRPVCRAANQLANPHGNPCPANVPQRASRDVLC